MPQYALIDKKGLYIIVASFGQLCLPLLIALLFSTAVSADWHHATRSIMGTEIRVSLWHTDKPQATEAINAVMAEMQRINDALSPYLDASELSRLNRLASKERQAISPEMRLLLDKSLYFGELSKGAFDISFASVGWRYNYREAQQPSETEIASLLPAINYKLIELDRQGSTVRFQHPDLRIDLGGVAKGYAVDRAIALLEQRGISHASVSAGGDSRLLGDRRGQPWRVGIKKPRGIKVSDNTPTDYKAETAIVLPLQDTAVSTSGDYERYFIDANTGERIHHIINPRTGKSASGIASVTVLGPKGIDTDPLSTSVFVMGVTEGLRLVNQMPGFDCVIIDRSGKVHYSAGLEPAG